MSLFASANMWASTAKACGAPKQSPINLSQTFAKSCEMLCELVLNDVAIDTAEMTGDSERGLVLKYGQAKPTSTFNGDGYTAFQSVMTHPSQHTVEGVQAQAEFITYFSNPAGKQLAVSVLIRTSPGDSASVRFFNAFVPFLTQSDEPISVALGSGWVLGNAIPSTPNYYVYDGSDILPTCNPTKWVVFADTVNMDPSDFAVLSQRVPAGSRPLQQVGEEREVFFNDTDALKGSDAAHLKNDGKVYMKCRRIGTGGSGGDGKTGATQPVTQTPLLEKKAEEDAANLYLTVGNAVAPVTGAVKNVIAEQGPLGLLAIGLTVAFFWYMFFTSSGGDFVVSLLGFVERLVYYIFRWPFEWIFRKPVPSPN